MSPQSKKRIMRAYVTWSDAKRSRMKKFIQCNFGKKFFTKLEESVHGMTTRPVECTSKNALVESVDHDKICSVQGKNGNLSAESTSLSDVHASTVGHLNPKMLVSKVDGHENPHEDTNKLVDLPFTGALDEDFAALCGNEKIVSGINDDDKSESHEDPHHNVTKRNTKKKDKKIEKGKMMKESQGGMNEEQSNNPIDVGEETEKNDDTDSSKDCEFGSATEGVLSQSISVISETDSSFISNSPSTSRNKDAVLPAFEILHSMDARLQIPLCESSPSTSKSKSCKSGIPLCQVSRVTARKHMTSSSKSPLFHGLINKNKTQEQEKMMKLQSGSPDFHVVCSRLKINNSEGDELYGERQKGSVAAGGNYSQEQQGAEPIKEGGQKKRVYLNANHHAREQSLRQNPSKRQLFQIESQIAAKKQKTASKKEQQEKEMMDHEINLKRKMDRKEIPVQEINNPFIYGELVWGKIKGYSWWPGKIVHHHVCHRSEPPRVGHAWIQWYGDGKYSQLAFDQINSMKDFSFFSQAIYQKKKLYKKAAYEVLKVAAERAGKEFDQKLTDFRQMKDTVGEAAWSVLLENLICWASEGFEPLGPDGIKPADTEEIPPPPSPPKSPPRFLRETRHNRNTPWQDTREERIRQLTNKEIALEEFCIGCGDKSLITSEHPLFVGGLCEVCRVEVLETAYMFDDDGFQCHCCICAEGDEIVLCGNKGCYHSFCFTCLNVLVSPNEVDKVRESDPWRCYMCRTENVFGFLQIRADWPKKLLEFFRTDRDLTFSPLRAYPALPLEERKPIRVLSLFDGVGTGMHVLRELGFKIEVYYASEINSDAIIVSSVQQHGAITHIGDVEKITSLRLKDLGPIDLLIGGSPCNDLSIVNPARKGIYDMSNYLEEEGKRSEVGTGQLFFQFYRILNLIKPAPDSKRPFFWMFENVVFMGHKDKMTICQFLECYPVLVDAKDVSPAHRARYFWGNLPGMTRPCIATASSQLKLQDCLEQHCDRQAKVLKVRTVTTRSNSLKQHEEQLPVVMDGEADTLWCTELERLFGFPDHYTDVCNMSRGARQKLIGKAWSVPVIRHLFAPLKDYFTCEINEGSA